MLRGFLEQQEGEPFSYDDVVNFLLLNTVVRKEYYPNWPIWQEISPNNIELKVGRIKQTIKEQRRKLRKK